MPILLVPAQDGDPYQLLEEYFTPWLGVHLNPKWVKHWIDSAAAPPIMAAEMISQSLHELVVTLPIEEQ